MEHGVDDVLERQKLIAVASIAQTQADALAFIHVKAWIAPVRQWIHAGAGRGRYVPRRSRWSGQNSTRVPTRQPRRRMMGLTSEAIFWRARKASEARGSLSRWTYEPTRASSSRILHGGRRPGGVEGVRSLYMQESRTLV